MPTTTKDTLGELQWLSDRLSAQVRMVSLAVLAVAWALLISPVKDLPVSSRALLLVTIVALLALVADLLQYVIGYANTRRHHRHLLKEQVDDDYDTSWALYRVRISLFWGKQALAISSFLFLVVVLLPALLAKI